MTDIIIVWQPQFLLASLLEVLLLRLASLAFISLLSKRQDILQCGGRGFLFPYYLVLEVVSGCLKLWRGERVL